MSIHYPPLTAQPKRLIYAASEPTATLFSRLILKHLNGIANGYHSCYYTLFEKAG
jgi:hypothetical protein